MKETLIATVRHGTTEFNRLKKIAGTIDIPLDKNGIEQTIKSRPIIKKVNFDIVISSPLSRALETARLSTGLPKNKIVIREECRERNYGEMQGLFPAQVKKLKPKILYVKSGIFFHSLNPPGGETFEQLRSRAEKFANYIFRYHQGKKIAVFSHQTFLQQFHGELLGRDPYNCLNQDIFTLEINYFLFHSLRKLKKHYIERIIKKDYNSW